LTADGRALERIREDSAVTDSLKPAVCDRELRSLFTQKYGEQSALGWGPRLRWRFGYFTPDDVYESLISKVITTGVRWLDVGCGRDLFPSNPSFARTLAARCERLVGVDPSANVLENPLLHDAHQTLIDEFETTERFDVATLRMVAEHIAVPHRAVAAVVRTLRPGGRVVVYTVNRRSPLTIASRIVPFSYHHGIKKLFWRTEEKDTFPVEYRMNTRAELKRLFCAHGCTEEAFMYLDDCRTFARFRWLSTVEIVAWKLLHAIRLRYPETCLLGVYRMTET
jgi:2-polyprenyl-3-methyl-5-hydroxy-6-metoxy-1,4-benzoquinol methylase